MAGQAAAAQATFISFPFVCRLIVVVVMFVTFSLVEVESSYGIKVCIGK